MAQFWSTISVDVKKMVVEWLDYKSRCNMRLCSKSDKDLVDSTKFVAEKIQIENIESQIVDNKSTIRIDIDNFSIWFTGSNVRLRPIDSTSIDRGWDGFVDSELAELKQENRFELVKRFLDKLFPSFKCHTLEVKNWKSIPTWKFNCQHLYLREMAHDISIAWLHNQTAPRFKSLLVTNENRDPIPLPPIILNVTRSLHFLIPTLFDDEHLDRIEAIDLNLTSLNLTKSGVKRAIERHLKYGKLNDKLELRVQPTEDYSELLPRSLSVKKTILPEDRDYYFEVKVTGGFENVHRIQTPRVITMFDNGDFTKLTCEIESKIVREHLQSRDC